MAKSDDNTGLYTAGVLALLVLFGTGMGGKTPQKKVEPPKDDEPDQFPFADYGSTPSDLAAIFQSAEDAAGIPGMGRFLAVWAWGAFRAFLPFVDIGEALTISLEHPEWCTNCHNTDESEAIASQRGFERVVLAKGVQGQYAVGAYDPPWPPPADLPAWQSYGSAGLMDILSSSGAYAGYQDDGFAPLLAHPPSVLLSPRVSVYAAAWITHRILSVSLYDKVFTATPRETWSRVRAMTARPDYFVAWAAGKGTAEQNAYVEAVMARFQGRAQELGIDLDSMPNPSKAVNAKWPGASQLWNAMEIDI